MLAMTGAETWTSLGQWIRSTENWPSPEYGTVTLVDRRLVVTAVYRVPFESQMHRDGLFVDLSMPQHGGTSSDASKNIRLCNVHLESLAFEPPLRPGQMKVVGEHLHEHGASAGLMAGDTNAIQDFDKTLAAENNLQDVYLSLDAADGGGVEDAEEGNTWGYQSKRDVRDKYPPRRMDKMFWCGDLRPVKLEKIGVGVCVEKEKWKKMCKSRKAKEELVWCSRDKHPRHRTRRACDFRPSRATLLTICV